MEIQSFIHLLNLFVGHDYFTANDPYRSLRRGKYSGLGSIREHSGLKKRKIEMNK